MNQDTLEVLNDRLRYVQTRFESELAEKRSIDGALSFPASSISLLVPALVGAALALRNAGAGWTWIPLLGLGAVAVAGALVAQVWSGFRYQARPTLEEEETLRRIAQVAAEKGTILVLRARRSTPSRTPTAEEIYLREMIRRISATTDHTSAVNRRRRDLLQGVVALLVVGLTSLALCGTILLIGEGTP